MSTVLPYGDSVYIDKLTAWQLRKRDDYRTLEDGRTTWVQLYNANSTLQTIW